MAKKDPLKYQLLDRSLGLGLVPDPVLRSASRWSSKDRLRNEERGGVEAQGEGLGDIVGRMKSGC